ACRRASVPWPQRYSAGAMDLLEFSMPTPEDRCEHGAPDTCSPGNFCVAVGEHVVAMVDAGLAVGVLGESRVRNRTAVLVEAAFVAAIGEKAKDFAALSILLVAFEEHDRSLAFD